MYPGGGYRALYYPGVHYPAQATLPCPVIIRSVYGLRTRCSGCTVTTLWAQAGSWAWVGRVIGPRLPKVVTALREEETGSPGAEGAESGINWIVPGRNGL